MRWVALVGVLAVVGSLCLGGCDGDGHKNQAPEARISASPETGPTPLVVTLDASASTDKEDRIESYAWVTGDGATLSGVTVTHTYERPGEFTVTLTVTDHTGKTSTASQVVTVENRPPVAGFKPYQAEGFAGAVMRFDASASTDPDGEIVAMEWDLGDGNSAVGPVVEHRYAAAGRYIAALTLRDELGGESELTQGVSVRPEMDFPAYREERLGCPPGVFDCMATHISGDGLIAIYTGWNDHLYRDGIITALASPNGLPAVVADMNEAGQMTGWFRSSSAGFSGEAFLYENGSWSMPTLPDGAYRAWPVAINEQGDVLANIEFVPHSSWRPFILRGGHWISIPAPEAAIAMDINDNGEVTGWSSRSVGYDLVEAVSWTYRDGIVQMLEPYAGAELTYAYAINNSGEVAAVAAANRLSSEGYALLYKGSEILNVAASVHYVPTLCWYEKYAECSTLQLTNSGWVMGQSPNVDSYGSVGFRWKDGEIERFDPAGTTSTGYGINGAGDMIGQAGNDVYVMTQSLKLYRLLHYDDYGTGLRAADINNSGEIALGASHVYLPHPYPPAPPGPTAYRATPVALLFSRLVEDNDAIPAARGLSPLITDAKFAHEEMDLPASCERLYEYDDGVRALTPAGMTQEQADQLRAQTAAIEETLICP